jgi:hypothetical protein
MLIKLSLKSSQDHGQIYVVFAHIYHCYKMIKMTSELFQFLDIKDGERRNLIRLFDSATPRLRGSSLPEYTLLC